MAKIQGKFGQLKVGRILSQDEDSVILEIQKSQDTPIDLFGGEQFLTLIFVRSNNGKVESWDPWEGN